MTGRVRGKVVFVTGAARGQGRAHAVRLAREGADIIAVDRCAPVDTAAHTTPTAADLDETARLVKAEGGRVHTGQADVRDHDELRSVLDEGVAALGRLDAVIANAGIAAFLPHQEIGAREWADMIDINLTGAWFTCQVALRHLLASGAGASIVLVSSTAAQRTAPMVAHYTAAKHGLLGVMKSLARELAPEMIRVNALLPTAVDTPMFLRDAMIRHARPDLDEPTLDDALLTFTGRHLLPVPWVEPRDVANAALFLISDEARYVTGVALPVDAGRLHS
jgi:(+)-trans-carveol dehydrogenase